MSLLDRVSAAQVNAKCSSLIRLCITQQLAADMSINLPQEGLGRRVEWIKSLVLSLLDRPPSEETDSQAFQRNFKNMIQAVLDSIRTAYVLIQEKNSGENSELNLIDIPANVSTDLQLLEMVIRMKG